MTGAKMTGRLHQQQSQPSRRNTAICNVFDRGDALSQLCSHANSLNQELSRLTPTAIERVPGRSCIRTLCRRYIVQSLSGEGVSLVMDFLLRSAKTASTPDEP